MLAQDTTPRAEAPKKPRAREATPRQQLLTLRQIEREYGPPYRSLYDLCVTGKLPYVRFVEDGRMWVRREDWEALIKRSTER